MGNCTRCGRTTTILVECSECHEEFCEVHRSPADHECRSVSTDGGSAHAAPTRSAIREEVGRGTTDPRVLYPQDVVSRNTGEGATTDDEDAETTYTPMDFDPTAGITRMLRLAGVVALVLVVGLATAGVLLTTPAPGGVDDAATADPGSSNGAVLGGAGGIVDSLGGDLLGSGAPTGEELNGTRVEYMVHEYVNEERREAGVAPAEYDGELAEIAAYHSRDMGQTGYVAHTSPDGETTADRYREFGYACETNGEIVQWLDYRELERSEEDALARLIVENWMRSDIHRSFVLDGSWERQGVGVYLAESGRLYVAQNTCSS